MSQLPPAEHPSRHADPAAAPVVEPGFEVTVQIFWEKNRGFILGMCAVALLTIVLREGWQYYSTQHEAGVQEEFARIADQPGKLAAFADANSGHALAGVALLRLADDKYAAGDLTGAAAAYTKAIGALKNEALLGRAKLGAAMCQINGNDKAAGEAALRTLSADATLLKGVRAEATYHVASLAAAAGKSDEVKKLVEQISRIDPTSSWSQRATLLLANLPAGNAPAAATSDVLSFKPGK
jgi:predicted negative regulator of RcsB-dependent stress response